jgi:uncharacterized metal-binding protein
MPSGKTHDAITLILAMPTFAAVWAATHNLALAVATTAAMLFGGFVFGPDLDTQSVQYTRWGIFRFIWFPYKVVFRHRSRWSHGLLLGTLIRVLYFAGVIALIISAAVYLRALALAGAAPSLAEIAQAWQAIETHVTARIGAHAIWAALAGLWWGAATHTIADVFWTAIRKAL